MRKYIMRFGAYCIFKRWWNPSYWLRGKFNLVNGMVILASVWEMEHNPPEPITMEEFYEFLFGEPLGEKGIVINDNVDAT